MGNKTAIVTGASGNLGQVMVKKFLAGGYKVIGTVIPNDPVALDITDPGFDKVAVDLLNEDESAALVNDIVKKYGTVDVAVLTVGGFAMGKIADTNAADIHKQYKLNFETAYHIARPAFMQMMRQGSGRIFIIGSRPGLDARDGKGTIAYGLAKSLLFRLAELMNEESRGHDVVTSVVVPGIIDTPQNRKLMPDAEFENWVKPDAIADTIYFYCTDAAASIREPVIKLYNKT